MNVPSANVVNTIPLAVSGRLFETCPTNTTMIPAPPEWEVWVTATYLEE